eukprot:TRINITY_DN31782_c0_g1_i1.p1 TRINITY_DN31782_c0_g1~~TRINITY_DN31782_c0_g1_i1.p1  ORF type:complete len:933 (+),score=164.39 TRINITY_DN31782_c0_g1_i1:95-2893(+)
MPIPPGVFEHLADNSLGTFLSTDYRSPGVKAKPLAASVDDFYGLVVKLTDQFDRERARTQELAAENARLRTDLRMHSAVLSKQRSELLVDGFPQADGLKLSVHGSYDGLQDSAIWEVNDLLLDVELPKGVGRAGQSVFAASDLRRRSKDSAPGPHGASRRRQEMLDPPVPDHPAGEKTEDERLETDTGGATSGTTTNGQDTPTPSDDRQAGSPREGLFSMQACADTDGHLLPPDIGKGRLGWAEVQQAVGVCDKGDIWGVSAETLVSDELESPKTVPNIERQTSGDSETSELELLPLWTAVSLRRRSQKVSASSDSITSVASHRSVVSGGSSGGLKGVGLRSGDILYEKENRLQMFMLNPNGWMSMTWDLVSVIFVLYDLITIPLQVFELQHAVLNAADLVVALVWTIDIIISFFRGVTDEGAVDMRPCKVATKYLRTWFLLDVAVVLTDWMLIASDVGDGMEFSKILRGRIVLRMLRIFRLVRIMKLANKENSIVSSLMNNESNKAMASVLKLLTAIVLVNHYVACGWYGISSIPGMPAGWIDVYLEDSDKLNHYLTAVHWSVTQFTPASMHVLPVNRLERAVNVVIIFFGLCMFSSFVSNMTGAMNHLNKLTSEQRNRNSTLRQYVADNKVSLDLLSCIMSYQRSTKNAQRKRLHEKDVAVFKTLPEDLLQKLHEEVYGPVLQDHPLFSHLTNTEESIISSVCHLAMSETRLPVGEELFRCGARGSKMFFVISGSLAYFRGYDEIIPQEIYAGDWLCEVVLWAKWEHRGRVIVAAPPKNRDPRSRPAQVQIGELMALDAAEFHSILSQGRCLAQVQTYANVFAVMAVQDCRTAHCVDDLWGSRAQVTTCLKRAFGLGDEGKVASKLMMLWDDGTNTWTQCYRAWKQAAEEERAARTMKPDFLQRAKRLCIGRVSRKKKHSPPLPGSAAVL